MSQNQLNTHTMTERAERMRDRLPAVSRAADACKGLLATAREHAPNTHTQTDIQRHTVRHASTSVTSH